MKIAKELGGADYAINYSKPGWQKEVLALTNDRGVDVIYDPVGLINGNNIILLLLLPSQTATSAEFVCDKQIL